MNTRALFAIIGVFAGCCSNVVFLELLVKYVKSSVFLLKEIVSYYDYFILETTQVAET